MHYIALPVADMRELPESSSKMVSQALLGEEVQVEEIKGEWARVITPDQYAGWVLKEALFERKAPFSPNLETARLSAHLYALPDTEYGPIASLPFGAKLKTLDLSDPRWIKVELPDQRIAFIQKGDTQGFPSNFVSFSRQFLGLPYTWGGRSSFGYDCSGFVQMVYGRFGILLPRDARQQIADPKGSPVSFSQLALGDLIFWGRSESLIRHVGIFLQQEEFIHASAQENKPYLRISRLDDFVWSGNPDSIYPFRTARRFGNL